MTRRRRAALAALICAALTACSNGSGGAGEPDQDPPTDSAVSLADEIAVRVGGESIPVTRSNDSDGLLGHRYGYLSAAAIQDPTVVACDEDLDAEPDCGAMLEQWPDADAAAARSGVLLGLYRDGPLTGSEHHYLRGGLLLRVWGGLSESRVAEYAAAFAEPSEK